MTRPSGTTPEEVAQGERFAFGRNWRSFLAVVDDDRIREAERSLEDYLETDTLRDLRFLDVGCGSGLLSLAAHRLGAKVHSFDYDGDSVIATEEMRRRYGREDREWTVERGSVLDDVYLAGLGRFDVVYAWGVLHHTGAMWDAIDKVVRLVVPGGRLFLSIYNDQGHRSHRWRRVKQFYCSGRWQRMLVLGVFVPWFVGTGLLADLRARANPLRRYTEYRRSRGMSLAHDWVDWLGGYPFEVARPEAVLAFLRARGFELLRLLTVGSYLGCNQFVFRRKE